MNRGHWASRANGAAELNALTPEIRTDPGTVCVPDHHAAVHTSAERWLSETSLPRPEEKTHKLLHEIKLGVIYLHEILHQSSDCADKCLPALSRCHALSFVLHLIK